MPRTIFVAEDSATEGGERLAFRTMGLCYHLRLQREL
jgi:hypothetical protein